MSGAALRRDRASVGYAPLGSCRVVQLSAGQVLLVWALAALPMGALAWIITPAVVSLDLLPPAIVFWLLTLLGSLWECALAVWLLRREGWPVSWGALRQAAWLRAPTDRETGERRAWAFGWLAPSYLVTGLTVGLASLAGCLALMVLLRFEAMGLLGYLWPSYMNVTELGSPEFAGKWWLLPVIGAAWLASTLLGEELLFRGVLLPRMAGAFGRSDWASNALLFGLYHLHKPWLIPFRAIGSLIPSALGKRYQSVWLSFGQRGLEGLALLGIVLIGVTSVDPSALPDEVGLPYVERRPVAIADLHPSATVPTSGELTSMPGDVRSLNLSGLDLSGLGNAVLETVFDTRTVWPPSDRMPAGPDPSVALELGKDPGLGVRALHSQGIDGRGVGVAVVDQPLLTEHEEYADRLMWYEEINPDLTGGQDAAAHGPSVASIAVGKTVGVAPGAKLYYVGFRTNVKQYVWYAHNTAQAIRRVVALNDRLPADRKIRVISISQGWGPRIPGYYDANAAVREAEAKGLLVVLAVAPFAPEGLSRAPIADPNSFASYSPGGYWADEFLAGLLPTEPPMVPMDARTTASATGPDQYEFDAHAGISWAIPYQAGLYALAAQVDPTITPARFLSLERQTGRTTIVERNGKRMALGPIVDPAALIAAIGASR